MLLLPDENSIRFYFRTLKKEALETSVKVDSRFYIVCMAINEYRLLVAVKALNMPLP